MTFAVEIVLEIVLFVQDFVFSFPFGESKFHGRSVLVNPRHTKTKGNNPSAWTCDTRQGEVLSQGGEKKYFLDKDVRS